MKQLNIIFSTFFSLIVLLGIFSIIETSSVSAATSQTVIAHQQVSAEIAITVASSSLTLSPAIPGMTGGTGNATTSVTVVTGNQEGYSVTIQAVGSAGAMNGEVSGDHFADYDATNAETWSDTSSGQPTQFGFGVTNTGLSDTNQASGYGTCATVEACFSRAPTTTPKTIVTVNTNTAAEGDSFELKFRAHIPPNPNPMLTEDWYTATTTLTALAI